MQILFNQPKLLPISPVNLSKSGKLHGLSSLLRARFTLLCNHKGQGQHIPPEHLLHGGTVGSFWHSMCKGQGRIPGTEGEKQHRSSMLDQMSIVTCITLPLVNSSQVLAASHFSFDSNTCFLSPANTLQSHLIKITRNNTLISHATPYNISLFQQLLIAAKKITVRTCLLSNLISKNKSQMHSQLQ